jgi:recombination protein RecT
MTQQTGLSTAIAERQQQQGQPVQGPATMGAMLDRMAPEFGKVLSPRLPVDTFMRLALTEVRNTPRLLDCSGPSLLGALMTAARLSLEPGGPLGQFYLTPRNIYVPALGRKEWQVVPIIGYRGLRDLALRTGLVHSIQAFIIREGDEFEYGSNETRGFWHEWRPADSDEDESDRPWKGVLTIAQLPGSGKPVWRYLGKGAVLARKKAGAAGDRGPWADFEEAMVRKTGIRAIANDLPSSSVMREAVLADERVQVWTAGDTRPRPAEIEAPPAEAGLDQQTGEVPTTNPEPEPAPRQRAPRTRRQPPQKEAPTQPPAGEQEAQGARTRLPVPGPDEPEPPWMPGDVPVEEPPADGPQ